MAHTPTCPECGSNEFRIEVQQTVTVFFDGEDHEVTEDPYGNVEWDDTTVATCNVCDHEAPLGQMKEV